MTEEIKIDEIKEEAPVAPAEAEAAPAPVEAAPEGESAAESFDEMLEKSFKTLNNGDKVTGIVASIGTNEITVDLSGLALSEIRAVAGFGDAVLDGSGLTLASQTSVVLR